MLALKVLDSARLLHSAAQVLPKSSRKRTAARESCAAREPSPVLCQWGELAYRSEYYHAKCPKN